MRLPWTSLDLKEAGLPDCYVLVPEMNGRLDFPEKLSWGPDGGVPIQVTIKDQPTPSTVWFWLVECDDGSERRFAWWNTYYDRSSAVSWT